MKRTELGFQPVFSHLRGAIRHPHEPSQGPMGASALPELPEPLAKSPPTLQRAAGTAKKNLKNQQRIF